MSVDPLASKYPYKSPYIYVSNNPINAFDPDGRDEWLLTWAPKGDQVGHSAIAIQQRDAKGKPTGKVTVRHLWPESPVGKSGEQPADYRVETVNETDIGAVEGGEGRPADGVIKITGDQAQDNTVTNTLDNAESNKTYNAETNNCSSYTKKGVEAIGINGGNGGNVKVEVYGVTVYYKSNVTTPVSVHNAVANSKDKRVNIIKPLPKDKQDPNIKID